MIESSNISYIYTLSSSENPEVVRYIGYSKNPLKRHTSHIYESRLLIYRRHKWIQSELKKGNKIEMGILACFPEKDIQQKEIEYIKLYKSFGANLVNGNEGGIGGRNPSQEVREKIRQSKMGNTWNIGRKISKETLLKRAKKMRGQKRTPEQCENIRQSLLGRMALNRKYTKQFVFEVYDLYNKGAKAKEISQKFNIPLGSVSNILYNNKYCDFRESIISTRVRKKYNK